MAIEDPGYRAAAAAAERCGWAVWDAPVDDRGLRVDRLGVAPTSTRAYYVTTSHQHPLGGLLPVPRRLELLAEATRRDAIVFEDDYDSEFRYDVAPLPALGNSTRPASSIWGQWPRLSARACGWGGWFRQQS